MKRGKYGQIEIDSIPSRQYHAISNLVQDLVDHNHEWEFGAEFDDKKRGYAVNWDVYEYGRHPETKRLLAVIQVRKFSRKFKNHYANIQKSYYLIGRNADEPFAHCVESRVIHAAIRKNQNVINAVQKWINKGKSVKPHNFTID